MGGQENLDLLRLVGEALYGERWQAPIAADLGVSDRAVRYWLSSANPCPDDVGMRLLKVIIYKRDRIVDLEDTVRKYLASTAPSDTATPTAQLNEGQ